MIFASSWDDGHPLDERLADMLSEHGFTGTFFVPLSNREGLPVMSPDAMRRLARAHEVGSHTLDHVYLRDVTDDVMRHQVGAGKTALEQTLGQSVRGFCYPGGKFNSRVTAVVREAGFEYARSTEDLWVSAPENPFRMATTLQFFPHGNFVFARHLVKGPRRLRKMRLFLELFSRSDFRDHLRVATKYARRNEGVLHIWGHSWEIERYGLWGQLAEFLRAVADLQPISLPLKSLLDVSVRNLR